MFDAAIAFLILSLMSAALGWGVAGGAFAGAQTLAVVCGLAFVGALFVGFAVENGEAQLRRPPPRASARRHRLSAEM